jgi:hypothetical protein
MLGSFDCINHVQLEEQSVTRKIRAPEKKLIKAKRQSSYRPYKLQISFTSWELRDLRRAATENRTVDEEDAEDWMLSFVQRVVSAAIRAKCKELDVAEASSGQK